MRWQQIWPAEVKTFRGETDRSGTWAQFCGGRFHGGVETAAGAGTHCVCDILQRRVRIDAVKDHGVRPPDGPVQPGVQLPQARPGERPEFLIRAGKPGHPASN